jgi:hypothetical protein
MQNKHCTQNSEGYETSRLQRKKEGKNRKHIWINGCICGGRSKKIIKVLTQSVMMAMHSDNRERSDAHRT